MSKCLRCARRTFHRGRGDQCWHEQTGLLYTCFIVHKLALCRPCPNTTYYTFDILFLTCHVSVEKRIPRVCVKGNMSMVFQRISLNTAFTKTFLCISRLVLCTASLGVISLSCSTTSSRITSTIPSVHATHTKIVCSRLSSALRGLHTCRPSLWSSIEEQATWHQKYLHLSFHLSWTV